MCQELQSWLWHAGPNRDWKLRCVFLTMPGFPQRHWLVLNARSLGSSVQQASKHIGSTVPFLQCQARMPQFVLGHGFGRISCSESFLLLPRTAVTTRWD